MMTACLYPVAEGIEISTSSERVIAARREVLTLLAARCPNSPELAELAAQYDVKTSGRAIDPERRAIAHRPFAHPAFAHPAFDQQVVAQRGALAAQLIEDRRHVADVAVASTAQEARGAGEAEQMGDLARPRPRPKTRSPTTAGTSSIAAPRSRKLPKR